MEASLDASQDPHRRILAEGPFESIAWQPAWMQQKK